MEGPASALRSPARPSRITILQRRQERLLEVTIITTVLFKVNKSSMHCITAIWGEQGDCQARCQVYR